MGIKSTYKFQQIGTFDQFCKAKKQPIKENNELSIDVQFWDDAVSPDGPIFKELHCIAGNPINWDTLIEYIKIKFQIIDRNHILSEESLAITHLRDLLFQNYGDAIVAGDICGLTYSSAELATKSLVISQLAKELLYRVRIEAGLEQELQPKSLSRVSLDYDCCDELPFEQRGKVADYEEFSTLLKESVSKIKCEQDDRCLDYVLNVIQTDCGGLDVIKIREAAEEEGKDIAGYISRIVDDYLSQEDIEINGEKIDKEHKALFSQAKKVFAYQTAKDVMAIIAKENKPNYAQVK